jgi:hypothetical protein
MASQRRRRTPRGLKEPESREPDRATPCRAFRGRHRARTGPAGGGGRAAAPPPPRPPPPGGLPCQSSDNSILRDLDSPAAAKRLFTVRENVKALVQHAGFNNVGFLTLTFKGGCPDIRVAQKRFNSFATNVLRKVFGEWICVVERHRKGGVHFHLVVDTRRDIRTAKDGRGVFDFDAVKRRDYRSANDALRGLWRFFREKARDYGFGERAIELLPIRVSANAVGNYVGKYLNKHLANRRKEDRRKKMVRYSKGANRYRQQFSWASPGAACWRVKIGALARCCGGNPSAWNLKETFGPRWAHRLRPLLCLIQVDLEPGKKPTIPVAQWTSLFKQVQTERLRLRPRLSDGLSRLKLIWQRMALHQRKRDSRFIPSKFSNGSDRSDVVPHD